MPYGRFGLTDPLLTVANPCSAHDARRFRPFLSSFMCLGFLCLYKFVCARSEHWRHLTAQEHIFALGWHDMQLVGAKESMQLTNILQFFHLVRKRLLMRFADGWRSIRSAMFCQFLSNATDLLINHMRAYVCVQSMHSGKISTLREWNTAFSRRCDIEDWAKQQAEEIRHSFMAQEGNVNTSTASKEARAFYSALSVWSLPALNTTALMRRERLRDVCAHAKPFVASSVVAANIPREEAVAALEEGLALATHLLGASPHAIADMHADVLACVALWSKVTGRARATVQLKLMKKTQINKPLHLDHVDARILCALYGKGTEWVASPGVVHAAASFADNGGGGTLAGILKSGLAISCPALGAAVEREIVLIRGTANPYLMRGQSRFHRTPDINASSGGWRLLLKVDDGPGWWYNKSLNHLRRPGAFHRRRNRPISKLFSPVRSRRRDRRARPNVS